MSQETLADLAGIDRTYVSMLERGLHRVSLELAAAVAGAFDLTLTQLMERVDREPKVKVKPARRAQTKSPS